MTAVLRADEYLLDLESGLMGSKGGVADCDVTIQRKQGDRDLVRVDIEYSYGKRLTVRCVRVCVQLIHLDIHRLTQRDSARVEPVDPRDAQRIGELQCYLAPTIAEALDSYEVLVDSKKLTSCSVSLAAAIHLAGLETL